MESKQTLINALVKAQSQMLHAFFDQTNPHFKSKFASLKSVIDAVKPALNANGIAFVQKSVPMESGIAVETVFYGHGEELSTGPVPVPVDRENAQGFGSALTYAKRYSLAMACGVAADSDDDGNAASAATKRAPQTVQKPIQVDQTRLLAYVADLVLVTEESDHEKARLILAELNTDKAMKKAVWQAVGSNVQKYISDLGSNK